MKIHVKEIREKIITLLAADLAVGNYPGTNYVVTDRVKLLPASPTTVFVEFQAAGPLAINIGEICWIYEYHVWLRVKLAHPDVAMDAMDDLIYRAVKSLSAHGGNLDAYTYDSEQVYKFRVGRDRSDIDQTRAKQDGTNNYFNFTRIKVFAETTQGA